MPILKIVFKQEEELKALITWGYKETSGENRKIY
jgi:hypothetical protein